LADAAANVPKSEAVKAEEGINTARNVAIAEREKAIQLIGASQEAQQLAISVKVAAEAEREAEQNRALAMKVEANAKREAALAEAESIAAINDAKNKLGAAQIDLAVRLQLIEALPEIIAQASKPTEKIDSIRLFQMNGMPMNGLGASNGETGGNGGGSHAGTLPEQVMNSALQYQVAKPIVDAIMKDAGLANPSLTRMADSVAQMLVPIKPAEPSR
jgi:uncharacterized membrane protein YqiK